MNLQDPKYTRFALVREMMETPSVVRQFDNQVVIPFAEQVKKKRALFLTGEGSSRIFPAKRAIYSAMQHNDPIPVFTEGATQALEYQLDDYAVFGASNSGKTKEIIRLLTKLKQKKHDALFGLTAHTGTKLEELTHRTHVLNCGNEDAVAATKSVVEQALFYDVLQRRLLEKELCHCDNLAGDLEKSLTVQIDDEMIRALKKAGRIFFAGRNDGVAEELTLKTNEITRKKSDYLEGTYAVHGIEEVMDADEVVVVIDPFESEEEKMTECLVKGVGMTVLAIASRPTSFPTIIIPDNKQFASYLQLAAGWNLLVEIGLALDINLDKPVRARKVGNEF